MSSPSNLRRRSSAASRRGAVFGLQTRRATAIVVLVALLVMLGAGIFAGARYAIGYETALVGDLRQGAHELELGRTDLSHGTGDNAAAALLSADRHFASARADFQRADKLLTGDSDLNRMTSVPGLGPYLTPRLHAAHEAALLGIAVADAGRDALPIQRALVVPSEPGLTAGQRLVNFLKGAGGQLNALEQDLQRASDAAGKIDNRYLPAGELKSLDTARKTVASGLEGIRSLRASLPGLLDILGANGQRTYLIEQMNPAELRAGGGFIGSYGILRVDGGKFGLIQSAGIAEADYPRPDILNHCIDAKYDPTPCKGHTYVRPPSVMLDFLGDKSWVLGDSNFWPSFPDNAKAGQTLTAKELQTRVDGVIAIDPQFLASLLNITGPIDVPGFSFRANGSTFAKDLFEYENSKAAGPATVRKAMFSYLAPLLIDKITTLPPSKWQDLVTALNTSAAAHDLQIYFNSDAAQKEVSSYDWGGVVPGRAGGDFMMEVESNFGGTKANAFVSRSYDVQLTVNGGTLHHKVSVAITDAMPANRYEGQNFYRFYARFYYPSSAGNGRVSRVVGDKHQSDESVPAGLKILDGWQQVNVDPRTGKGSDYIVFEYDTPLSRPAHDIYWQKQAGTNADGVTVTLTNGASVSKVQGDLGQDLVIHIAGDTVSLQRGSKGGARLPGISL